SANGKPHSHALGLGRVKWLEHAIHACRFDAWSGVPDRDEHAALGVGAGADLDLPCRTIEEGHGLDRVQDQVHQYLVPRAPLSFDEWQTVRELRPQGDVMT